MDLRSFSMTNRSNPRDPYKRRNPIQKNLRENGDGLFRLKVVKPQKDYKRVHLRPRDIEELNEDRNEDI